MAVEKGEPTQMSMIISTMLEPLWMRCTIKMCGFESDLVNIPVLMKYVPMLYARVFVLEKELEYQKHCPVCSQLYLSLLTPGFGPRR